MKGERVAFLLKRFPRLSETFILNEILELQREGLDVVIYALMDPRERVVHPAADKLCPAVVYLHSPGGGLVSWMRLLGGAALQAGGRPLGAARVLWAVISVHRSLPAVRHAVEGLWLARDLRARGVDHLHAHFAHSPTAVAYMTRLAGGPNFSFTAHAKDLYTTLPRNLRIRARAASFVVTCTDYNRRYLESTIGGAAAVPVHVFYHGTRLSRFSPAERRPVPGRIVSVGRLVAKKGHHHLVDAVVALAARGVDCTCDIYGGGPLREELARHIEAASMADRVRLMGARPHQEILEAYRGAAVFALGSVVTDDGDRDGIPNVLVEAMACGTPVVSTLISGIPELVEAGSEGLLVEPGDAVALAAAIECVLSQPGLGEELAAAARRKVERLFDVSRNTHQLLLLLQRREVALAAEVGAVVA